MQTALCRIELSLATGVLELTFPENEGIFARISVVFFAPTRRYKAKSFVKLDGGLIGNFDFEGGPRQMPICGSLKQPPQHQLSQSLLAMLRMYRHDRNMRFIDNCPNTAIGQKCMGFLIQEYQNITVRTSQLTLVLCGGPKLAKACLIKGHNLVEQIR